MQQRGSVLLRGFRPQVTAAASSAAGKAWRPTVGTHRAGLVAPLRGLLLPMHSGLRMASTAALTAGASSAALAPRRPLVDQPLLVPGPLYHARWARSPCACSV